jgi:hypothetical protein
VKKETPVRLTVGGKAMNISSYFDSIPGDEKQKGRVGALLDIFVDGAIVEVFANGGEKAIAITYTTAVDDAVVLASLAQQNATFAFEAWGMKPSVFGDEGTM